MTKVVQPPQEYALGRTAAISDLAALRERLHTSNSNLQGLILRGDELFATFTTPPTGQELVDLITAIAAG